MCAQVRVATIEFLAVHNITLEVREGQLLRRYLAEVVCNKSWWLTEFCSLWSSPSLHDQSCCGGRGCERGLSRSSSRCAFFLLTSSHLMLFIPLLKIEKYSSKTSRSYKIGIAVPLVQFLLQYLQGQKYRIAVIVYWLQFLRYIFSDRCNEQCFGGRNLCYTSRFLL